MDNGYDVDYTINEAISIIVNCKDQKEIDYFWESFRQCPRQRIADGVRINSGSPGRLYHLHGRRSCSVDLMNKCRE
jgi:hypothetical protein